MLFIDYPKLGNWLPFIYPPELELTETNTVSFASFLDFHLKFDGTGRISTNIYDKQD